MEDAAIDEVLLAAELKDVGSGFALEGDVGGVNSLR